MSAPGIGAPGLPVVDVWHQVVDGPLSPTARRRAAAALLARALDRPDTRVDLRRTPSGKPVLADGEAHVSVTHTGRHLLVAVTRPDPGSGPVGLDAEELRVLDVSRLAPQMLCAAELAQLAQLGHRPGGRTQAVLRAWTRKEALLKADGVGLGRPPREVRVDLIGAAMRPGPAAARVGHAGGRPWVLYDVAVDDRLVAALATTGPARVRVRSQETP